MTDKSAVDALHVAVEKALTESGDPFTRRERVHAAIDATLAAPATDEPCPGCRVYHDLGHPDRVPDAASATDEIALRRQHRPRPTGYPGERSDDCTCGVDQWPCPVLEAALASRAASACPHRCGTPACSNPDHWTMTNLGTKETKNHDR